MAIRRLSKRDRVYFYDFYEAIMAVDSEEYEFDITQISFPIHGVLQQVSLMWDKYNPQTALRMEKQKQKEKQRHNDFDAEMKVNLVFNSNHTTSSKDISSGSSGIDVFIQRELSQLSNLYHLCVSANMINNLSLPLNNHCLFSIIDSIIYINYINRCDLCYANVELLKFISSLFNDIVQNETFTSQSGKFLTLRNYMFVGKNNALLNQFISKLENENYFDKENSQFFVDFIKFLQNGADISTITDENKINVDDDQDVTTVSTTEMKAKDSNNDIHLHVDDLSSIADSEEGLTFVSLSGMNILEYYFAFIISTNGQNRSLINMFCVLLNVYFNNAGNLDSGADAATFAANDINDIYHNCIHKSNGIFHYLFKFVKYYQNGKYISDLVMLPLVNACNSGDKRSIVDFYCHEVFSDDNNHEISSKEKDRYNDNSLLSGDRARFSIDLIKCAQQVIRKSHCIPEILRALLSSYNFLLDDVNSPSLIEIGVLNRIDAFKNEYPETTLNSFLDVIEILSQFGCDFTLSSENLIEKAIEMNDVECLATIIECCHKRDDVHLNLLSVIASGNDNDNDNGDDNKDKDEDGKNNADLKPQNNDDNDNDDDGYYGTKQTQFRKGSEMLIQLFKFKNVFVKRRIFDQLIYASSSDSAIIGILFECPEFDMRDILDIEKIFDHFHLLYKIGSACIFPQSRLLTRIDQKKLPEIRHKIIELIIQFSAQNSLALENGLTARFRGECNSCYKILDSVCGALGVDSSTYTKDMDAKIEEKLKQLKERSIKVQLQAVQNTQHLKETIPSRTVVGGVKNVKYFVFVCVFVS